MPDAFPSGHALLSMIVIVMSWRLHRPTFRLVVGPAVGCVIATMVLRYHYVVDVLASVALLPGVVFAGLALYRWWDRPTVTVPTTLDR
jgi:membrane-associated phospholipid phosphatase